jgi:hypothetical protein
MPVAIAGFLVILALLGLGFYAIRKMRLGSFRLQAKLLHVVEFTMAIEPPDIPKKQIDGVGQGPGLASAGGEPPGITGPLDSDNTTP